MPEDAAYRYRARRDPFNSELDIPEPLPDRYGLKCKRAASVTATNMPKKVHGRDQYPRSRT